MNGLSESRALGDSSPSLPEGSLALAKIMGAVESGALATIFGAGEVGAPADFCSQELFRTGGSHGMRPSLACAAFWYSVSGLGGGVHFLRGTCGSRGLSSGSAFFSNWAMRSLLAKRLPLPDGRLPGVAEPPSTRDIKSIGIGAPSFPDDNFVASCKFFDDTGIAEPILCIACIELHFDPPQAGDSIPP